MSTSNTLPTIAVQAFCSMISARAATSMRTALKKKEGKKTDGVQITDDDVENVKSSDAVKKACKAAKDQLEGEKQRAPRGLYDKMDELRGLSGGATSREIASKKNIKDTILEDLAKVNVDSVFMEAIKRFTINDWNETTFNDSKHDICHRTASCPFNSIIREDLKNKNDILARLQTTAIDCTDLYDNMCTIVHINMLRYAALGDNGTCISIKELVPRGLDDTMFDRDDVKVTTYPESPQADTNLLFTMQHIQYLYTNHFGMIGAREKTHKKYPIWKTIMGEVTKKQNSIKSYTAHEVIQQLATNLSNMYNDGKLIRKLLENLLKVLLDIHLPADDDDDIDFTNIAADYPTQAHADVVVPSTVNDPDASPAYTTIPSSTLVVPVLSPSMLLPADEQRIALPEPMSLKDEVQTAVVLCPEEDQRTASASPPISRQHRQRIRDTLRSKKHEKAKLEERAKSESLSQSKIKRMEAVRDRVEALEGEYEKFRIEAEARKQQAAAGTIVSNEAEQVSKPTKKRVSVFRYGLGDTKARRTKVKGFLKKILMQKKEVDRAEFGSLWDGKSLSTHEMAVIVKIYHSLRPLLRHVYNTNCAIASQIPFCHLANRVLIATGNRKQTRALTPFPAVASIHSLPITPTTLLEILGDMVPNPDSIAIAKAKDHKEEVMGLLFATDKVKEVCKDRRLQPAHRITMTNHGLARILGTVEDVSRLAPTYKPTPQHKPLLSLSKQEIADEISNINDDLKRQSKEIEEKREAYASLLSHWDKERMDLGNHFNPNDDDCVRAQKAVKELKQQLHDMQFDICRQDEEMRVQKKKISTLNTASNASAKSREKKKDREDEKIVLTADNMRCLAPSHTVDISQLQDEGKQLGFVGVDYGFHTLSTSVAMIEEHVSAHLDLVSPYKESTTKDTAFHALVKPITTKSHTIAHQTGELRRRRRLEAKKNESSNVFTAEAEIAKAPIAMTINERDIQHAKEVRDAHKDTLRRFYHSKSMTREKRQQEYRVQKWKDRVLSFERKCMKKALTQEAKKAGTPLSSAIFMIGGSGMGYGSTIKGFIRYGGKWLRIKHSYHWPVLVVDEYRTSQVCAFCGWQIQRPRTANKKKSQGGCLCINPRCVSFFNGRAASGRDTMAATNISVKGVASTQGRIINGMERNIGSFLLASKL